MESVKIRKMMFITVFMVLIQNIMSNPLASPRTTCLAQFSLANQACILVPFSHDHMPQSLETKDGHNQEQKPAAQDKQIQLERVHEHRHGHGHGHKHGSRRRHRREQHHHWKEDIDCCRWLKEVDSSCVCGVLFGLPLFLKELSHSYSVSVGDECEVTFDCPGKWGYYD